MIRHVVATATHVGRIRDVNQDRSLVNETIVAVADGMGGHAGGERAASLAIGELSGVRGQISAERLMQVAHAANDRVYAESADPDLRGMGTTLVAAVVDHDTEIVRLINVGDSRAYRCRDDVLEQVTVDHSLVEDLVREGRLSREEADHHPQRNIVTRALGISNEVEIDSFVTDALPGDRFLLCSDGLFNEVDDATIVEILGRLSDAQAAAEELVAAAVEHGGRDNVTVALIDIIDSDGIRAPRPTAAKTVLDRESRPDPAGVATVIETSTGIDEGATTEAANGNPAPGSTSAPAVTNPGTASADASGRNGIDGVDGAALNGLLDQPATSTDSGLPLRGLLLAAAVVGVLVVALGTTAWYARSAWYADSVDGEVVILRGRPDGVLWWDPVIEETTVIEVEDLEPSSRELLETRPEWSSIDDARVFVENLEVVRASSDGG